MAQPDFPEHPGMGMFPTPEPEPPLWEPSIDELRAMYEQSVQPTPPPGFLDRLAMGLQGIQGPSWGVGAALAGFGQGFAGARMGTMQRGDMNRARQNQANLEATRTYVQSRMNTSSDARMRRRQREDDERRLGALTAAERRAAANKDAEYQRDTIEVNGRRVPVSSALGQWVAAGRDPKQFREPMSPEDIEAGATARARGTAKGSPAPAPKIGPEMPTLTAIRGDFLRRADAAAQAFNVTGADSLRGFAGVVDRVHGELREAQTPEAVDSINVPDGLPPDLVKSLADAARRRKAQLGNAGRPATR